MIRGEIFFADLSGDGHVLRGMRPVVIVSNNVGNHYSGILTVVPITSAQKKPMPTHVSHWHMRNGECVHDTILCENVMTISKSQILDDSPVNTLSEEKMREVDRALSIAVGLVPEYNILWECDTYETKSVCNPVVDSGSGNSAPVRYRRSGARYSLYGDSPDTTTDNRPGAL